MGKRLIVTGADFSVNGIPTEYQVLAWIGGTTKNYADTEAGVDLSQGQYISSGINTTINTRIVTEFILDANTVGTKSCYLTGCANPTPAALYVWPQPAKTLVGFAYQTGTTTANIMELQESLWDSERHVTDISKGKIVIDSAETAWTSTPDKGSSTTTGPIYLDCCYQPSSGGYNTKAPEGVKICRVKVYTDYSDPTSLVVDAIPAMRLSDNKIGFYNLVNGEWLLRNNGTNPTYGTL